MYLYTALGDSITAGVGATSPGHAFPSVIVNQLQARHPGAVGEILAEPGWTSRALSFSVFQNPTIYLQAANAITIWVGGDNLVDAGIVMLRGAPRSILQTTLRTYGSDLSALVSGMRRISRANIILCTQYNPFPNTAVAEEAISGLNLVTQSVGARLGTQVAPVHSWFAGRQACLIAGYRTGRIEDVLSGGRPPVHPNNTGHLVIARGLAPFMNA